MLERGETLAELATKLGLPESSVETTVDRWNELCRKKFDEDFGRPSGSMLPITEPPFFGGKVWSVISNTQGGPVHDAEQQIIKVTGESIDRLYGAGEMGSAYGHLYLAGANVAECFIAGRVAGRQAANRDAWT